MKYIKPVFQVENRLKGLGYHGMSGNRRTYTQRVIFKRIIVESAL